MSAPLNGGRLVAALPVTYHGNAQHVREWLVVVERADLADHYVSARVDSLDSPTWSNGYYAASFQEAMSNAISRAGWGIMQPTNG